MAVINCFECGGKVSTTAKSCPHCGASRNTFKKTPSSAGTVILSVIGLGIIISFFGGKDESKPATDTRQSTIAKESTAQEPVSRTPLVASLAAPICKAAISTVMLRPASDITATERFANDVYVSYIRANDSSFWEYNCKLDGNNILWRGKEDGAWLKWRGGVSYSLKGHTLTIRETIDGEELGVETFELPALR